MSDMTARAVASVAVCAVASVLGTGSVEPIIALGMLAIGLMIIWGST